MHYYLRSSLSSLDNGSNIQLTSSLETVVTKLGVGSPGLHGQNPAIACPVIQSNP